MHLTDSQMIGLRSTRDWQARRKCEAARSLENIGDYEGARSALDGLWTLVGERPLLDGLAADTQADLLLRVGSLTGYLGSALQIAGAQELAKDLLSESVRCFGELGDDDKMAEAQTDLAICYWRDGAMDEARICLSNALARASFASNILRILTNSALVEVFSGQPSQALELLDQAASLLDTVQDHASKGRYHMQRALALKRISGPENLDRALIENTAAAVHFEEANHKRYLARVENNIGSLLLEFGRNDDALQHLDKARAVFISLGDSGSVAQVNETRARAFMALGRHSEGEHASFSAVSVLEHGGELALLAEALTTYAIARARLGRYQSSRDLLLRAGSILASMGNPEAVGNVYLTAIEELHQFLPAGEIAIFYKEADARLGWGIDQSSRLRRCAQIMVDGFRNQIQALEDIAVGGSFKLQVKRYEAELIRRALDQTGGSVTRAARMLGMTHQALSDLLKHRHMSLESARTPRRPRRKSIVKHRG